MRVKYGALSNCRRAECYSMGGRNTAKGDTSRQLVIYNTRTITGLFLNCFLSDHHEHL